MNTTRRRGLTLPEVLITLAIIAVIAAVLLPALAGQLPKGDAGRVAEDLKSIQTGIGAFVSDVRRYPRTINQLTLKIATGTVGTRLQTAMTNGDYTTAQVNRWRGPYLIKSVSASDVSMVTGFEGVILGDFTSQGTIDATTPYVRIVVTGLDQTMLDRVDGVLDDAVSSTGLFRTETVSSTLSGTFYPLPVQ